MDLFTDLSYLLSVGRDVKCTAGTRRSFATRVSQLKIWDFWVIGIERNVCRCAFDRYSVITQFAKLAAGEQLCRRWTRKNDSTSKPFKSLSWKITHFELWHCCWRRWTMCKYKHQLLRDNTSYVLINAPTCFGLICRPSSGSLQGLLAFAALCQICVVGIVHMIELTVTNAKCCGF